MRSGEPKKPPAYVVTSADHALRAASILQLEGGMTLSEIAERLDVARSTAHRLLQTLVYRDFAVQDDRRVYHPGPVLELARHSQSSASGLRSAALPHLSSLAETLDESVNLTIRTDDRVRFIASVECRQVLRVGSREGMVFPAHKTSAGLVLLADLPTEEIDDLYAEARYATRPQERPDMPMLNAMLARVRRAGFALNDGLSERGVFALGVPVRAADGRAAAGLAVAMPSVRFDRNRLPAVVSALSRAARAIEYDNRAARPVG